MNASEALTDTQRLRYIRAVTAQLERTLAAGPVRGVDARGNFCNRVQAVTEAAGHLAPEIKRRHPEVPWAAARALRNHTAHDHPVLRPQVVELAASTLVPKLRALATAELALLPDATVGAGRGRRAERVPTFGM